MTSLRSRCQEKVDQRLYDCGLFTPLVHPIRSHCISPIMCPAVVAFTAIIIVGLNLAQALRHQNSQHSTKRSEPHRFFDDLQRAWSAMKPFAEQH